MDSKQVLVVDNDIHYLDLLTEVIQRQGYRVIKASDALQGIEMVKKEPFYCIFVDLIMPRVDGVRFLKCIREEQKLKEVPITIVSAALTDESPDLDMLGANFYLYKGPEEEIKKNVVEILRKLENEKKVKSGVSPVLGIEGLYQRAVVKELMSQRRHQEVVLENMGEAVIETDSDLRMTYINPAGMKIFKKTAGQIIGGNLYDLFTNESSLKIKEVVSKLSASSDPEVATLTVSHEKFILKIIIANLIKDRKNMGTVMIAGDVTDYHAKVRELMLANEKIKKMQEKLIQEAKFSVLGQLSTNFTGEIENPLISALSYISLLLREERRDDSIRDGLEVIQEEVLRARNMIRDLIDFGEEGESSLERIELDEILKRIVALVKHRADSSKVKIVEEYGEGLPLIYADANKIKQVFFNLINNAFEAMPNGGTLTITTSANIDESFSDAGMKNIVQIEFADTGVGISPDFLPQIFTPFFSVKPERNASGLGLSTSLKIIQDLGGTIEVDSKVGGGSTFIIKVPLPEE